MKKTIPGRQYETKQTQGIMADGTYTQTFFARNKIEKLVTQYDCVNHA